MATRTALKVHLDHLIPRESLRWVDPIQNSMDPVAHLQANPQDPLTTLRVRDLDSNQGSYALYPLLRKPDFQRETSAWSPDQCVELLDSILKSLIVPSLIVWKSPENTFIYLLDGAHRVSVVRAWILDDWGDHAPAGYYERHEYASEIPEAASQARLLVSQRIGSYKDIRNAGDKFMSIAAAGGAPAEKMSLLEFERGKIWAQISRGLGFHVQEVVGDYNTAETSFIRINVSGERLEDWEITLIRNRNSSFARSVMSLANGGAGHFWPEKQIDATQEARRIELSQKAGDLHDLLFVPPLKTPVQDANVPFIASTRYFAKHAYLMELIPVVMEKDSESLFELDQQASNQEIIDNGLQCINQLERVFRHLSGASKDPLSLSIVPLFYFYSRVGRYVRSALYGFISWMMSGTEDDIRDRKSVFSAHRSRFEEILWEYNVPGAITDRVGSGLRAVPATSSFYQRLLELLAEDSSDTKSDKFRQKLDGILKDLTARKSGPKTKEGRQFDDTQKTAINIREIYSSAIRCEICGGILNLRSGVQYDHKFRYAETGITDPETGRPTHPFCNNMRDKIEEIREGRLKLPLPQLEKGVFREGTPVIQPTLWSLMDSIQFPDE